MSFNSSDDLTGDIVDSDEEDCSTASVDIIEETNISLELSSTKDESNGNQTSEDDYKIRKRVLQLNESSSTEYETDGNQNSEDESNGNQTSKDDYKIRKHVLQLNESSSTEYETDGNQNSEDESDGKENSEDESDGKENSKDEPDEHFKTSLEELHEIKTKDEANENKNNVDESAENKSSENDSGENKNDLCDEEATVLKTLNFSAEFDVELESLSERLNKSSLKDKSFDESENFFDNRKLLSSTMVGESSSGKRGSNFDKSNILTQRREPSIMVESRSPSPEHHVVIDISDEEKENTSKNMNVFSNKDTKTVLPKEEKNVVSKAVYLYQKEKVTQAKFNLQRSKNLLQSINISTLPDGGKMLQNRYDTCVSDFEEQQAKLETMICDQNEPIVTAPKPVPWLALAAESGAVQPKTFGKQAMATHNLQKALTMDRLQLLHGSLKTCPDENVLEEDPKGLKVELMNHQKHALAWLMWRENQKPSGGILADDMGLGKTLTMISLMLKIRELEDEDQDKSQNDERTKYKYKGGTLVVCPGSLLGQWEGEVQKRLKRGLLTTEVYHGPRREESAKRLSRYDMVITTYAICMNEADKSTPLFKIKWARIILDEAHQVRNYKSQTSEAVCKLAAYSRWVLTGTPIHNKELDLYALLKFLRCTPFDDLTVFKKWVSSKSSGGPDRLNTVMSSLMLRRTKEQLQIMGSLNSLPERQWDIITIEMDKNEKDVYEKVLLFSQTLLYQYLHQGVEKRQDALDSAYFDNKNNQYYKMYQKIKSTRRVKTVAQHEILVLLLRLRQICCHPTLILEMIENGEVEVMDDQYKDDALNLLDQLKNLNINDDNEQASFHDEGSNEPVGLAEATRSMFNPSNPIFDRNRRSSKVDKAIQLIEENILPKGDKCIIVSQWTGFLGIIAEHLVKAGVSYLELTGKIPVNKRSNIVNEFNDPKSKKKVLLLSLTAGGVGLNLVGANHLLLLDIHWNPQLEMQAQDRIYRVGQTKPVRIYKLTTVNTIEERINQVQDKKKALAEAVLTGAKIPQNKLSLDDLRMIFNM